MRIELADENWVEIRDRLQGGDRTAVNSLIRLKVREGEQNEQEMGADLADRMHDTLLASLITAWSFPEPIPRDSGGADAVGALDLDVYLDLHAKTVDIFRKVTAKLPN